MTISLKNINFGFPENEKLFKNFNLSCKKGEITTIMGKSGCGKTTLLNIFNGLIKPDSGTVNTENNIHATIFQNQRLIPYKTIKKNIEFGAKALGLKPTEQEIENILLDVGLPIKIKDAYPKILSGGMAQRVSLARALICKPKILFMDEPFTGLDNTLKNDLMYRIVKYVKTNNAYCLFITHDMQESVMISDNIYKINSIPIKIKKIKQIKQTIIGQNEKMINNLINEIKYKIFNSNSSNFSKFGFCNDQDVTEQFIKYMQGKKWVIKKIDDEIKTIPTTQPDLIIISGKHKLIKQLIKKYENKTTRFLFINHNYDQKTVKTYDSIKKLINWWGWDNIYKDLIKSIPKTKISRITIGHNWCFTETKKSGGLSRTPSRGTEGARTVPNAGDLKKYNLRQLAELALSDDDLTRCIGISAINCHYNEICIGNNNEQVWGFATFRQLTGSKACIGNFPVAQKVLPDIKIIELEPKPDQYNVKQGEKIVANTDYLIITAQTIMNGTLPRILFLAQGANITLIGPTAPLSNIWEKYGVNTVCGVRPTDNEKMQEFVAQAGTMLILDDRAEKMTMEF